jgi:hypothetical protein
MAKYYLKAVKYSRDRSKKYEYRSCTCGCDYWLLIIVDVLNGKQYETRETSILENHDTVSETLGHCHRMDKEVSSMIVQLMEQNQFSKSFGPKRIMSELCRHNISKDWIPSKIQIQNKLSYHH